MSDKVLIAIAAVILVGIGAVSYYEYGYRRLEPWNPGGITASYLGAELRETDPGNASLLLSYELQNNTDADYRLSDGPGVVVMSRLATDGSLSSQEGVQLSYSTFLPARQRARVMLEMRRPFTWPASNDPATQEKLKDFINQRLSAVDEFVLFDQSDRVQIEFPRGWQEFKLASAATAN
jgi:hypothetical protein